MKVEHYGDGLDENERFSFIYYSQMMRINKTLNKWKQKSFRDTTWVFLRAWHHRLTVQYSRMRQSRRGTIKITSKKGSS